MPSKFLNVLVIVFFVCSLVIPIPQAHADNLLGLPEPGVMVNLSPAYEPMLIKGLKIHPENPFLFDFIIDTGSDPLPKLKQESSKLIKYFLTAMTVPEKDLWVNLSPYEKNRMIASNLAQTEMGRDMLAQDYVLKQLTASLIYPERNLGKVFWDEVYAKARELYGTAQVPVNTFNKVWVVADRADVYEHDNAAYVVGAHLKVMLEEDYLALQKHTVVHNGMGSIGANITRKIILPQLENEINQGKNFSSLRQMFYSMILASWYKMTLKDALLTRLYGDQSKVKVGINQADPRMNQEIFNRYLRAYKKGVFNFIRDDVDKTGQQPLPRKYFSGGTDFAMLAKGGIMDRISDPAMMPAGDSMTVKGNLWDEAITVAPVQKDAVREELKTFGFFFKGGRVEWTQADNKHTDWKPATVWSPKEGRLDIKQINELPSIEVESMVPFTKSSHQLYLAVADIEGHRQPVVIKQYSDIMGESAYYAMAFVPGVSRRKAEVDKQEASGALSDDLIRKRKKITSYFVIRHLHPPEEFIYTPDGQVIPIDAGALYSNADGFQIPNEDPAKEYVFSQLGGPHFYGLVKFRPADQALRIAAMADGDRTKIDMLISDDVANNPRISDLIKGIKNNTEDFAMSADGKGYQRLRFSIKERWEKVQASLGRLNDSMRRHNSRIVLVGALGFSLIAVVDNVSERIIALLDFLALVGIWAKELKNDNKTEFMSEHNYYMEALESYYENGSFSDGHSSQEVVKFYRDNFDAFMDNLDDRKEWESLELIAGTLSPQAVSKLKKEESRDRFAQRLLLALDRRNREKEEFRKTQDIYFNALDPDIRLKPPSKDLVLAAIDFYDGNSREFIHFLPQPEKEKIAEWLARELTTKKQKDRILKSRQGERGSIKWLMYDDLGFERAKEAAAVAAQDPAKDGGIDLNAVNMKMGIHKDGQGAVFHFDPAMIGRIETEGFDGLEFNIRSIVPVVNLQALLGAGSVSPHFQVLK